MKTPPLLLGAALLFWGWQTELLPVGLGVGLLLESSRLVRFRFELEQDHYNRLWNFCWLVFVGTAMYVFFAKGGFSAMNELVQTDSPGVRTHSLRQVSSSAMVFIQWLPLVYVPFMFVYAYSSTERLPWTTFSFLYQKRQDLSHHGRFSHLHGVEINPTYAYLMLVLVSSSATRSNPKWFFPCVATLILWAIWPWRNRRFSPISWVSVFLITLMLAIAGQVGLRVLRGQLIDLQNFLMQKATATEFDTSRTRTAIGSIGKLHQSNKIILRVTPLDDAPPGLLMEAAFNVNSGEYWTAPRRRMDAATQQGVTFTWLLNTNATPRSGLSVTRYANREGNVNLAMPAGPVLIDQLEAVEVFTNRFGAALGLGANRVATYQVFYAEDGGFAIPPEPEDLDAHQDQLHPGDRTAFLQVASQLDLDKLSDPEAVRAIEQFFLRQFTYSTYLTTHEAIDETEAESPLAAFLLDHKSGHCEYFAASTVHLLRMAGIPARYAVGYALQEKRNNGEWIARSRHAHAWALAWLDGRWRSVDTTPPDWNAVESEKAGVGQAISDWFSELWLGFEIWRTGDSQMRIYVFAGGVVILALMGWRQLSGKRWLQARNKAQNRTKAIIPGLDSDFYQIEVMLAKRLSPRESFETMLAWVNRLQPSAPDLIGPLPTLIELHYRHRFDPEGLSPQDRHQLADGARTWVEEHR